MDFKKIKRVVVKVGTSTLTHETGHANIRRMDKLIEVLSDLANSGIQIVLVTSGAIAVGGAKLGLKQRPREIPLRQAVAAVGQCELMCRYDQGFSRYDRIAAQVLLTKDIVEEPVHRRNVINTFRELFELGSIPIINENDTVATDELEGENFGDNDTLSAIVATLVEADLLIILSDIDGLFTANPHQDPSAKLIPVVEKIADEIITIATGAHSNRGTGGMATKISAAQIATSAGIDMVILNGRDPLILYDFFDGKQTGTHFVADK